MAGLAFSSFVFIKILVFIPAGWLGDKIGHYTTFFLGLFSQVLTMWLIIHMPNYVWAARSAEGLSLAFGTISALALLRAYAKSKADFGKSVAMMMGIGSSGVLLGPFFGYTASTETALYTLLYGSVILCLIHWLLFKAHKNSLNFLNLGSDEEGGSISWAILAAFALVKGMGVGTEPLLGWWATESIGLSGMTAGFTFVAAALGFIVASWKPKWIRGCLGIVGIIFLEIALTGHTFWWWPGLFCLGLFSGTIINLSLAKLGWNNLENAGLQNSKFLLMSDIPMMIMPGLLWEMRSSDFQVSRILLFMTIILLSLSLSKGRV